MFGFDFAISYASEEEGIASDLDILLREKGAKVFFAKGAQADLVGKRLRRSELPRLFGRDSRFVVPIISKHYVQKEIPKYEFEIAKKEAHERGFEVILPIRLDDVPFKELEEDIVYIDIRKEGLFGTAETLTKKLRDMYSPERVSVPQFWVVTFGISIEELVENYELPSSAPSQYAYLCDWLEKDLMKRLSKSPLEAITLLEDLRTGETLSVRVGFKWDPDTQPFDVGNVGWWEVLEIREYNEVYPDQDPKEMLKR